MLQLTIPRAPSSVQPHGVRMIELVASSSPWLPSSTFLCLGPFLWRCKVAAKTRCTSSSSVRRPFNSATPGRSRPPRVSVQCRPDNPAQVEIYKRGSVSELLNAKRFSPKLGMVGVLLIISNLFLSTSVKEFLGIDKCVYARCCVMGCGLWLIDLN
ncbi:hypothetical protein ACQJBY_049783 [Aegilops geniculata]